MILMEKSQLKSVYFKHFCSLAPRTSALPQERMPFSRPEAAAACVAESGVHCSSLMRAIAKIGCSGRFPGNAERYLFRVLSLPVGSRLINMFFFKRTTNMKQIQQCCFKFVSWFVPSNFKVTFYGDV